MALYKRGSTYWLNATIDGRRYQVSTGCDKKEPAEKWEAGFRNQIALGKVEMADRPHYTIGELLDRLKSHWQLKEKDSVQNLSLLKKAKEDFGTKLAEEITVQANVTRFAGAKRNTPTRVPIESSNASAAPSTWPASTGPSLSC